MTEVLIEENFVHIDGNDMSVVLAIVDRLGLDAEPTAPRHVSERRKWVLSLHWLAAGEIPDEVVAALPGVLAEICGHYRALAKVPPARLSVYGLNGAPIRSFEAGG
ncbi:hypothetical protein [Streptacidiphilus sp. P02-A3a]|uniref:hypothetical protein n=1 Tax=Streptacidiphilus sp. P02-A3a TaxID=2704468 RepID=UPI0015FE71A6|nr:hypothetical protein [Streptacidiphilus sp. P02-A3a]QMU72052.1 hypothetical protein GXP74_31255 [Streptacidiphilus sp. P02-A3a]